MRLYKFIRVIYSQSLCASLQPGRIQKKCFQGGGVFSPPKYLVPRRLITNWRMFVFQEHHWSWAKKSVVLALTRLTQK